MRRSLLLFLVAGASCLALDGAALAAVGDLSNPSCIKNDAAGECGSAAVGLESARAVDVSPDGKSVYAAATADDAIVHFRRSSSGALSDPDCVNDAGIISPLECGSGPDDQADGLAAPSNVTVSPDGKSVYVVTLGDDAVVSFDRNATTGALSNARCIKDAAAASNECGAGPEDEAEGLNDPSAVAVSPDNRSVYVASASDDALVRFDRDLSTGSLSNASCIKDAAAATNECGPDPEDEAVGLNVAGSVQVSPDGKSVYVAGGNSTDGALVRFDRDNADDPGDPNDLGTLTSQGCFEAPPAGLGCGSLAAGLLGASSAAVSPDGKSVYATGNSDDAIVEFNRNLSTGALSGASCIRDGSAVGCGSAAEGLDGPSKVAVSPDNRSVYVASQTEDAITGFDRSVATGALSGASCIRDITAAGCAAAAQGLDQPISVAVSPDGRSLYGAAFNDDTVFHFDRELASTSPPPPPPPPASDDDPPDTAIDSGPKRKVKTKKKKAKVTFEFSSEPGASFECSLDGEAFAPCTSPHTEKVKKGEHNFEVRARDVAGNVDQSPASQNFKVKRKRRK